MAAPTGAIGQVNTAARTLVYAAVVVLAYLGFDSYDDARQEHRRAIAEREAAIDELSVELTETQERVADLELALKLVKVDQRVAHLDVVRQYTDDDGQVLTEVEFQEVGDGGRRLGAPRTATIQGRTAYVDGLVIKFEDEYVEGGDALRGTSLVLFRRLFGEDQAPSEGLELDAVGATPAPYADDDGGDPELADLWKRFWDYAHDPEAAAERGVRAMHGEAPYIELREGGQYTIELRASGGLSIRSR